jgi:hypothetical protein
LWLSGGNAKGRLDGLREVRVHSRSGNPGCAGQAGLSLEGGNLQDLTSLSVVG